MADTFFFFFLLYTVVFSLIRPCIEMLWRAQPFFYYFNPACGIAQIVLFCLSTDVVLTGDHYFDNCELQKVKSWIWSYLSLTSTYQTAMVGSCRSFAYAYKYKPSHETIKIIPFQNSWLCFLFLGQERNIHYMSPYNDLVVVSGQGTIG